MAMNAKTIKLKYVCPDEYEIIQIYNRYQSNPEELEKAFMSSDATPVDEEKDFFVADEVLCVDDISNEDLREVLPNLYKSLHERPKNETAEGYIVSYEEDLKMKRQIEKLANSHKPIAYNRDNMGTCPGERNTDWKEEILQSHFLSNAFGIKVKHFDVKCVDRVLNKPLTGILLAKDYILPNLAWNWEVVDTKEGIAVLDLLARMVKAYENQKQENNFSHDDLRQLWQALIQRKTYNIVLPFKENSPGISYRSLEYGLNYGENAIELAYNELAHEFGKTFTSQITWEEYRDKIDEDTVDEFYREMRISFRKIVNKKYQETFQRISKIYDDFKKVNKPSESQKLTYSKGEQVKFHLNLYAIMKVMHDHGDILPATVTEKENIFKLGASYDIYENVGIEKEIWESFALTKRYLDYNAQPRPQIERDEFLCEYYQFLFLAVQKIFKRSANQIVNIKSAEEIEINIYQFEKIFAFCLFDKETQMICKWIESRMSVIQEGSVSQEGLDNFIDKLDKQLELLEVLKQKLLSETYIFSEIYHFCGVYQRIEIAEIFLNEFFEELEENNGVVDLLRFDRKILKTKENVSVWEKEYFMKGAAEQSFKSDNDTKGEAYEACREFYRRILKRVVPGVKDSTCNQEDNVNKTVCKAEARKYLDEQGNLYKEVAYAIAFPWKCFDNVIGVK